VYEHVIDSRCEGKCRQLADAGNAHQPTARIGCPDQPSDVCVDRQDGGEHGTMRFDQTPHRGGQAGDAVARLHRLLDEGRIKCMRQPDAEHHSEAADLVLESNAQRDQFLSSDDQWTGERVRTATSHGRA
jgi:hypothetical protein